MCDRSTETGRRGAASGAARREVESSRPGESEKEIAQDWRHLPVTLSGGLSGVMACNQEPAVKKPETPLELFCHEQQRHERIAFMMRGDEHHVLLHWPTDDGLAKNSSSSPCRQQAPSPYALGKHAQHGRGGKNEDILMKDAGGTTTAAATAAAANTKHSSSPFRVELEVNSGNSVEDDPHLQEIRIAARIKTERIQRKGQRECREGRVRKKIRMTKRHQPTEPG